MARVRLTPEEERMFVPQLGRIVEYIDQLRQFESAPPLQGEGEAVREAADEARPGLDRAAFLANAPRAADPFLVVPAVKGGEDGA